MRRAFPALLPLVLAAASCGGGGGASFRFETAMLELGTMHQYEELAFSLPFVIEGSGKVNVETLDVTCGCTDVRLVVGGKILLQAEKPAHGAASPENPDEDAGLSAAAGEEKIELPAGTRGELLGTYRPEQRLNDQVVTVTIVGSMLNSPAKAQIHAFVKPAFVVAGNAGNFGTLRESVLRAGEQVREVTVLAPAPFEVKFWTGVPDNVLIEAVPGSAVPASDGAGVLQTLRLRLLPNTPVGTKQAAVSGETTLGPAPLDLLVAWRVLGRVTYAPEHLVNFQRRSNDREHEIEVKVRATSQEEPVPAPTVEFLGAVAGVLHAEVEALPKSNAGEAGWLVKVKLPKGTAAGVYQGTMRISYPADSGIPAKEMAANARVQEPR